MTATALFILNPASGSDDADVTEEGVVDRLVAQGMEVEVRRTEGEGDARRWAAEATTQDEVDVVVVAGGDGTVREAVSGVVEGEGDRPVVIVPTGTANLLARAFAVPLDDPAAAAALATEGQRRTIDVVHLVDRDDHAVIMVDAGFDAQLVRDADRGNKDVLGPFAYVAAGVRNLVELEEVALELEVDGEVHQLDAHTVLCLNIGRIGETVVVDPDIEPDDGQLHVGVVGEPGSATTAWTALQMVVGDRHEHANVAWFSGQRVRVSADPALQVQVDGDPAGETPFELELLRAAATLMVPAEASDAG